MKDNEAPAGDTDHDDLAMMENYKEPATGEDILQSSTVGEVIKTTPYEGDVHKTPDVRDDSETPDEGDASETADEGDASETPDEGDDSETLAEGERFQDTSRRGRFWDTDIGEEAENHRSLCSNDGVYGNPVDKWRCWHSSADQDGGLQEPWWGSATLGVLAMVVDIKY